MAYNILIVDDSPAMQTFVHRVLDLSGLEVGNCFQAENGEIALDVLRGNWIDIVLTDINMPVMDGEELVRQMSSNELFCNVPVVVVSTDNTEGRIRAMMKLGAKGYIKKPFVPETLRHEVEQVLGVRNA